MRHSIFLMFLSVFFINCSQEEYKGALNEEKVIPLSMPIENEEGVIAIIKDGEAHPLYEEENLINELIENNFFDEIESTNLVYGFNQEIDEYEAFLIIIGYKDIDSTSISIAFEADLIIEADKIILADPETSPNLFNKHSCLGQNCSSCDFVKEGFLNLKIKGCTNPCEFPIDNDKSAGCIHNKSKGGGDSFIQGIATIIKVLVLFF